MDFFEILSLMTEYSRQVVLLHVVEDVISFLKKDDYRFFDLLKALSTYAMREKNGDVEPNPSWEIVAQYLRLASDELEELFCSEPNQRLSLTELDILKLQSDYFRRLLMLQMVTLWLQALESERYRFSEILKALSGYAAAEAEKNPDSAKSWEIVAGLLRTASEEAERQGRELP